MISTGATEVTATGLHLQADFAPGTVLGERFRIDSILGIGGMGVVYRAWDLALGVPVALKLLRPELAHRSDVFERFRQELLLARQVSSPHVVRIHDLAQHDGRWVISMDLVDGDSLDHCIDKSGPLAIDEALRIARQIAEGLAAAHSKGVVHRDLKPANILLDAEGNAYISDFGVARSLATTGMTQGGAVVGTPDYLSPEQARGESADARSDLYALGLILYEMLSGKLPFAGGTVAEVLAQRMLRTPAPVTEVRPDVPPWLARLVDRLLRPQPAHRLQNAAAVITAIDRRVLARDFRPRRATWLAVVAVLFMAVVAVAGWQWLGRAPVAVAASPPLDRMLVLPMAGPGIEPARAAALSAHLRNALAVPGFAVVDGERTQQALRQLDPGGNARIDADAAQRAAAARRVLRPQLLRQGARWKLIATLSTSGSAPIAIDGPQADDPVAALGAWVASTTTTQALGLEGKSVTLALPEAPRALDRYGAGLLAAREGRLQESLQRYAEATRAAPGYTAAWQAQALAALAIGARDRAADAIEQGQRTAAAAPQALRQRLAAQRASIDGDLPAAIAHWRALLAATPDDTDAELNLARAQGAAGDLTPAIERLQALSQRDGNDPRVWFELGKFSILSGDAQRAVDDYLTRALVQFKRSRNLYGQAETVNALGIGYGRLGQSGDAIEQYRKAVELRHALGNRSGEATSLRNLGNMLAMAGRFDEAEERLLQARVLHAELGDRSGLAAVENELGLLAEERGDYPAALQAFRRALQTWQALEDPLGIAQALNDIGFAQFQLGAYNDAQVYLQQATDGYARLGDRTGGIRAAQDLGQLAIARGRWDDARAQLQRSLQEAESQQMMEEAAVSRRHLAELELWQGHVQASIDQAGKAEASFRRRDDARGAVDASLLHAEALLSAHAPDLAQRVLDALQPALGEVSVEQRAIAQLVRAQRARDVGDHDVAVKALRDARRLAASSGVRQLQLRIDLLALRMQPEDAAAVSALDAATETLGHAGLRLGWLELALQRALAARDVTQARALYREAAAMLRGGEFIRAEALHRLGAAAHTLAGDASSARAAVARADEARAALRAALPLALRARFDAAQSGGESAS